MQLPKHSPLLIATLVIGLLLIGPAPKAEAHDDSVAPPAPETGDDEADAKDEWDVATADLGPTETRRWSVDEGTWMCLDVSPDGQTIVFDLLGDIYTLPMEGGQAELLRGGRAWDVQPRFSPDGSSIVFTSDAGGGDNAWVMKADGSEARQVTKESFRLVNNPRWTPDGKSIVVKKHFTSRRSLGAGEMWIYDAVHGGTGVQMTTRPDDQKDVGEPELSPDGRWLYYSLDITPGRRFEYNKDPNKALYAIRRVDLRSGREETVTSKPGGAVRPELSPDGKTLAFVRRVRLKSVLMLRDLESGEERPLFDGLSKDSMETWSTFGVYPGYAWTPDGKAILIEAKGKIVKVATDGSAVSDVPFKVDIEQEVVEALRFKTDLGGETFPVRVIRWPRISPDGEQVVFQALGQLYVRDLARGESRRLTRATEFEFHPRWSPDGRHVVYTTWTDDGAGRVKVVRRNGGRGRTVVSTPGHYAEPSVSPDGDWIVYRRGQGDGVRGAQGSVNAGIHVVPFGGGTPRLVTRKGTRPMFSSEGERIILYEDGEEKNLLVSVNLLGGDRRELISSERATELLPSPDGSYLAFAELWQVYVCPWPATGRVLKVGPGMKNLPVRKASLVGGEFLDWSRDSSELRFSLGSELFRLDVDPLFTPPVPDTGDEEGEEKKTAEKPEPEPAVVQLGWDEKSDVPDTDVAFVNATVFTMEEGAVIENGTVRVRGNRIVGVGPEGTVDIAGAELHDLGGRVLMPGYVDVHAHTGSSNLGMHAEVNWKYLANLSFGVTTTHDPSNNTKMILASSELVRNGTVLGPRITSTGTILYGAEGDFKAKTDSLDDARRHLKRLKAWGAFSAKSYNQPRRDQRQWYVAAGRELEMMIVPEGGSFYAHNMTMVLDGHTTIEHAVPLAPLREDALELMAKSGTAYTPTLVVGYGGLWGENYWYERTNVWENERLMRFVPRSVVDPRSRRRVKAPEDDFHHIALATSAAEVERRGGNAQIGAHGQMQGLGVHWELWMFGQGGLTPMESLQVATLNGARAMGMDHELGSIKTGKLADLIVLGSDPREDLRRSEDVDLVMINGRLLDGPTLAQIAPVAGPAPQTPVMRDGVSADYWDAGASDHDCDHGPH